MIGSFWSKFSWSWRSCSRSEWSNACTLPRNVCQNIWHAYAFAVLCWGDCSFQYVSGFYGRRAAVRFVSVACHFHSGALWLRSLNIVLNTHFPWHFFHKTPEFVHVDADGVAFDPAFVKRFGFHRHVVNCNVKQSVGTFDFLWSFLRKKVCRLLPDPFRSHRLKTFLVPWVSHRGGPLQVYFSFDACWSPNIQHPGLFCTTLHRPSAYHGFPLSLAAQNGGCCLTTGYLKWLQGLITEKAFVVQKFHFILC